MSLNEHISDAERPQFGQKKASTWTWSRLLNGNGVRSAKTMPSGSTSTHDEPLTSPKVNVVPKSQPISPVPSELQVDPDLNNLTIQCENLAVTIKE